MKKPTTTSKNGTTPRLPTTMELAQLAVAINSGAERGPSMTRAMDRAMEFWAEADYFLHDLPKDPLEVRLHYASNDRRDAHMVEEFKKLSPAMIKGMQQEIDNGLVLDPANDLLADDPVRTFFKAQGFPMTTIRTVLVNIRAALGDEADDWLPLLKQKHEGRTIYKFPQQIMNRVVSYRKQNRSKAALEGWETKQAALKNGINL